MGKLVWLAAYPKSGTTWLRAFLHNYIRQPATPHDINALTELTTGESGAERYRKYDPRPASRYTVADVQRLRPLVHRDITREHPDLVFVKTHNAALVVEGVPLLTPEVTAGAIYLVRDPRDVAVSYSRHLGLTIDATIARMADLEAATGGTDLKVYERLSSWSAHVYFWTRQANPRLCVRRYEDLLADPAGQFGGLIRFLGQEPPPERLARAIRDSGFAVLRAQEQAHGFVERPPESQGAFFGTGRHGAWRGVLTAAQRRRIERDHGAMMVRFGYAADG
jgi:hypothetical protein